MTNLVAFSYITKEQKITLRRLYKEQARYYHSDEFEFMIDDLQLGRTFTFMKNNNTRVFVTTSYNLDIEVSYRFREMPIESKEYYINLEGEIVDK